MLRSSKLASRLFFRAGRDQSEETLPFSFGQQLRLDICRSPLQPIRPEHAAEEHSPCKRSCSSRVWSSSQCGSGGSSQLEGHSRSREAQCRIAFLLGAHF